MRERSFAQNYLFNLIYQILAIALPLVTTPYLSRVLGAQGIGQYSFAQSTLPRRLARPFTGNGRSRV